ncbi:MAG: bifunctional 2-polyprenyl-6-hydroxyphenol methylase/3-demethylubiquinol 3-O-methyltransferase UbiG [Xanthomonadales bacterium]
MNLKDATVDPRETAYYQRMAAFWWDADGPFWPLHGLNELRVAWIRERLCAHFGASAEASPPLDGLRVLDIGCGGGILSESMARLGARVTGIDVVEKNIRIASLHAAAQDLDIDYRLVTASDLAAGDERFDVVLNMEVVEHVADLPAFMAACTELVTPGGVMFVATINRTVKSWLFAKIGAEYVLRLLPRGTHRWREFRQPAEVEALLNAAGLDVLQRTGVKLNPFSRHFSLVANMNVNYMLLAARPRTG